MDMDGHDDEAVEEQAIEVSMSVRLYALPWSVPIWLCPPLAEKKG
jgi:hypothetical protein